MQGKIEYVEFTSKLLEGNPLGDPSTRKIPVYLPPQYQQSSQEYPVIYGLTGFSGVPESYMSKRMFFPSLIEIIDQLIVAEECPPFIYAIPDCTTKYGGSQYVNSIATGAYEDYIVKEIVPFIDEKFRSNRQHGVMGGSSGGIGAFTLAAKYPEIFPAMADHSGDSAFEYCYIPDFAKFVLGIEKYDRSIEKFVEAIPSIQPKDEQFMVLVMIVAVAACYSPNPDNPLGFELPFDIASGELYPEIWDKWLQFDPIRMVEHYVENLRKLKACFVDCGRKDQFQLYIGARQLHSKMERLGIDHIYEEYDSDHFLLRREQKRKSIPILVRALAG